MRRNVIRSITVLTILGIAFSVAVWALAASDNLQATHQGPVKRKTVREIGQERDFEFESPISETSTEYGDLRLLAQHCDAMLIGRIVTEESVFMGDDDISTFYVVNVERVLKDNTAALLPILQLLGEQEVPASLSTPLKFVRQGGVVSINGHRVAQTLRGSEALKIGQDYILFLHWSRDFKSYYLAGGMSGAVLIRSDLTVKTLGSRNALLRYNGAGLEAFIRELLTSQ